MLPAAAVHIRTFVAATAFSTFVAGRAAADYDVRFPDHPNVVDVTRPPYGAKGDGVADDSDALQKAINENVGRSKVLYFPPGTYVVSRTLTWPKKFAGRDNWGMTWLQGRSPKKCVLRLKDGTFTDASKPQAIMWCGGFGSADWFHCHVEGLTFSVGRKNPGAIGLQFYSNNYGAVRDCEFVSEDDAGEVGLDLGHRDMNGPLLVRKTYVKGFRRGVATAGAVNSQTFEHLRLVRQTQFGFDNGGQAISIRGLTSENAVPAVRSYGTLCLIEASLTGVGEAKNAPAVVNYNGGRIHLRDVATTGYARAVGDVATPDFFAAYRVSGEDKPGSLGPKVAEFFSHPPTSPFPSQTGSVRLPIEETPEFPPDDPKTWAVVDAFGADPTAQRDSTKAIQKALDSGARTIFLSGDYRISEALVVGPKVRRILGCGGSVDYTAKVKPDFRIVGDSNDCLTIEHLSKIGGGVVDASSRRLVLRSIGTRIKGGKGDLFLEDLAGDELQVRGRKVWARQLNIENEGTHLLAERSDVWILGYKTERGGALLHALGGSRCEVLGGFSYTTTAGKLAPMFVNDESSVFAYFAEVCYNNDPYQTLIRETRNGKTAAVARGAGTTWPYIGKADQPRR